MQLYVSLHSPRICAADPEVIAPEIVEKGHRIMDHDIRQLFIAWAPYGRRSELLARETGAEMHFIHYLKYKVPAYAPLKYVLQSLRTLQVLAVKRPEIVYVQSPPFVAAMIVDLYCRMTGTTFAIDHHTDSFGPRWKWASRVQQYLARRATINIVTNQHWAEIIHTWAARSFILPDPFVELSTDETFAIRPGFNVVFINTFAPDEPIDAVLEAAAQLPEVCFYITGNKARRNADFFAAAPSNVVFTGFVPDAQYIGLLRAADAVLALTTRDHTLQGGGCEAVSLGKPLITSDWPYLRELFARGTIYVANSPEGIRDGVREMQQRCNELEREIVAFRDERRQQWNASFARLIAHLTGRYFDDIATAAAAD
jgi:glycosyltransferase involved in cell wall biosynthesis